jgi:O-methyltransferase involved in polyketide biosynthesis
MSKDDSARISPTAYYTGHVWCRNGLSDRELDTREGRALFLAGRPLMAIARKFTGGVGLEEMLLQRHGIIDHLLAAEIEAGRIGQVLEVAAGMSGRGLRMCRRFPKLVYVEGDLPAMAARKRRVLDGANLSRRGHHVVTVDVLRDVGPDSLDAATNALFDTDRGTAIITEGLLNYFDQPTIMGMWRRFSRALMRYPHNLYLADVYLEDGATHVPIVRGFRRMLETFTRGRTHLHFHDGAQVEAALADNGFERACVYAPKDFRGKLELPALDGPSLVHVIEASTFESALGRVASM